MGQISGARDLAFRRLTKDVEDEVLELAAQLGNGSLVLTADLGRGTGDEDPGGLRGRGDRGKRYPALSRDLAAHGLASLFFRGTGSEEQKCETLSPAGSGQYQPRAPSAGAGARRESRKRLFFNGLLLRMKSRERTSRLLEIQGPLRARREAPEALAFALFASLA